jgi:long-subunit fatty acid transport protein
MPRRPRAAALAALAAFLAGAGTARAQIASSLNRAGSGARAAGMANAFVAVSDDGTAASWNPAGLAQLRRPEFSAVYTVNDRGLRFTGLRSPDGLVGYSNRSVGYSGSSVDFASAALPFTVARRPLTVQLGWQRVYQLSGSLTGEVLRGVVAEPATPPEQVFVTNELRGDIDRGSLSAAIRLTRALSLGASLNLWRGGWREQFDLVEPAPAGSEFVGIRGDTEFRGHNLGIGLLLAYSRFNVGLVYYQPFWSSFQSRREVRSSREPAATYDAGGRARFRLPRLLAAGLAWRPAPRWTLAVDLTHDEWTDALVDRMAGAEGAVNFFDGQPPAFSTTRDTTSVNLGGEHLFLREGSVVPLRLGLAWEPQGAMDPVTRDPAEYFMVAAGSGYNTNSLKLDAALQYRWGGIRVGEIFSVGGAVSGLRDAFGRSHVREWRFKLSVIYRVPDTEKLRDVVRKILG